VTSGSTWLTASILVAPHETVPGAAEAASRQVGRRWATLAARATEPVPLVPAAALLRIGGQVPEAREWQATVARFAGAVGRGRLDKAVLARRVDLDADGPIDVPAALRRLEATAPESTIFAVGRGTRTFLGATPERLVRSEGREFRTVAMAGSIRRGTDAAEDERLAAELLASEKDREEQAVVVEMLRETLTPVTDRLEIARRPSVVRLRHIQHLATEVRGRLTEPAGIVGLVERLHPTPAVGGAPRELALELIAEGEPLERGWYAGPVGWLDPRGDGEFVVAIRSGVVDGRTASLFAGCGIVADSDPGREWEESLIKLRALATALGTLEP
jgi:isochorismate synthase